MEEPIKPYFLPVKKEYYQKIEDGSQDCEIRPADHNGWSSVNIYPGRQLLISCGYGKARRTTRVVREVRVGAASFAFRDVPKWHIEAVEEIYGKCDRWLVAYVR
jgi:hypothetical protein